MRILLFLIISLVFFGAVVCSQDLNPKNRGNGDISDTKVSLHRFSLLNGGINGIFDNFPPAASEDSELKQFSSDNSFLIQEENEFIEGLEQEDKAESTIIWGGIFPFVSLPNEDVENREGFFSNDSIFFFWYLKKKF
ncbi:MAG: hypothetical protein HYW01_10370 [Deltaproteobacteria bacterium]|nr:hypothetical protein [Deltaproteobacteria bacterium]